MVFQAVHLSCGELRSGRISRGDHGGERRKNVSLVAFVLCISLTFISVSNVSGQT